MVSRASALVVLSLALAQGPAQPAAVPATPAPPGAKPPAEPVLTAGEHLELAKALQRAGRDDEAGKALVKALTLNPSLFVPEELRQLGVAAPQDPWQAARNLSRAGMQTEARTALEAALKGGDHLVVPSDLAYLTDGWAAATQYWLAAHALPAAILAVELVLLAFVLVRVDRRLRSTWKPVPGTVSIAKFDAAGLGELKVGDIGGTVGALVEQTLRSSAIAEGHRALMFTRGPIEPIEVPFAVTSAVPTAQPIADALRAGLKWIDRREHLEVCGLLHAPGRFGAGLTVMVVKDQHVLNSVTVWEADFAKRRDPVDAQSYYVLVEPAVIWLQYELVKMHRPGAPLQILGTRSWRSYAFFRAAVSAAHDEIVEPLYRRALLEDRGNRGARSNLAVRMIPTGPVPAGASQAEIDERARRREEALNEFRRVVNEAVTIGPDGEPLPVLDTSSILSRYMLAAVYSEDDQKKGLAEAETLLGLMKQCEDRGASPRTLAYLRGIRDPTTVMWASLLPQERASDRDKAFAQIDDTVPDADLQYNLACAFSFADGGNGSSKLRSALIHLRRAVEMGPHLAQQAGGDPFLTHVRNHASTRDEFARIVNHPPAKAATEGLALIELIGGHATALASAGIATPGDLVLRASNPVGLATLASALRVHDATVRRWALAAQLLAIDGVTTAHVNLLVRAQVPDVTALGALSVRQLEEKFRDYLPTQPELEMPPALELATWIRTAQALPAIT